MKLSFPKHRKESKYSLLEIKMSLVFPRSRDNMYIFTGSLLVCSDNTSIQIYGFSDAECPAGGRTDQMLTLTVENSPLYFFSMCK